MQNEKWFLFKDKKPFVESYSFRSYVMLYRDNVVYEVWEDGKKYVTGYTKPMPSWIEVSKDYAMKALMVDRLND